MWVVGYFLGVIGAVGLGHAIGAYPDASVMPGTGLLGIIMLIAGFIVVAEDKLY